MTGLSGRDFPEPGAPISAGYAHAKSAVRSIVCGSALL